MKLWKVVQQEMESRLKFFDRCYWNAQDNKVFLYNNKSDRDNPECNPVEIWDTDTARRYITTLESEPEIKYEEFEVEVTPLCDCGELMQVTEERLGHKPDAMRWMCTKCGKVIHEFTFGEDSEEMKNGN